ncbi:MAG TPA: alpha/beta hydrolase [Acetobacteraceae bacterium]|nr:alpha/beta hydrolase [Acetobacteraceae bacterium]
MQRQIMAIAGVELELFEFGNGPPMLFLHGANGFAPEHPYVPMLSERHRLIAPSHPGFGNSSLPDWIDAVDDVAYIYLELLHRLGIDQLDVIGCSLGGWLACELATKSPQLVRRLVLVAPVGVKTGPVDRLDIPDIFALPQSELEKLLFHDPERMRMDPSRLTDEQLAISVRNRETTALLTWEPYMHNPKLPHRLHRIAAPTLFVRGESDGLVSASYIESYARLLPDARVVTIAAAGHAPQLEQTEELARTALAFLESGDLR